MSRIDVREVPIEQAVEVDKTITEFGAPYLASHFEDRCGGREQLIIVAYVDDQPAGYIVGYDRDQDGSFYCWMAGVNPAYRGQGVLKALMDYQFAWAKHRGYTAIKLKTRNNYRNMLAYLVKYGFLFTEVVPATDIHDNWINLQKPL